MFRALQLPKEYPELADGTNSLPGSRYLQLSPPGVHKVEVYQVCWGRISSCEDGREYYDFKEKYNVEKEKQYYLPYYINVVGKNIKWGRDRKFWGRKSRFEKHGGGEEYQVVGIFITSLVPSSKMGNLRIFLELEFNKYFS